MRPNREQRQPKAKTMALQTILRWLVSYSTAQLMMLVGGPLMLIGSVITFITGLAEEDQELLRMSYAQIVYGGCWTAAMVLFHSPQLQRLMVGLSIVSFLAMVCYVVLMMRRGRKRRLVKPLPTPAVFSDKTWPPPPTSPGG